MGGESFSATGRQRWWDGTDPEVYDLLVIGGGITGAGIARDAACRGLRVVLVEAGDLGEGTSSLSSRLVHGGLRYLETFEFGLVFEALRERRRLLRLAPHLVSPLPFLFPVFEGDPTGRLKLTAGMWLYGALSLLRSPGMHRTFGQRGALEVEPDLRSTGLRGGALYFDAQVDDARLTLATARAAFEAGAHVLSRSAVEGFDPPPGAGEPNVVRIVDTIGHRRRAVSAHLVVNATGPWSDRIRRLADPNASPRLRTTKGVHIMVPRSRVGNRGAVIFRSGVDGRVMFILPWGEFTYIGTTDTAFHDDPATAIADEADVFYLLRSANGIFPRANLTADDVLSTWAGVRPLLAPTHPSGVSESATSREHAIWRDSSGLLNVAGGKLTTFRSMAAEVVDRAAGILHEEHGTEVGRCYTEFLPFPGAPEERAVESADVAVIGIDDDTLAHLQRRYGSDVSVVIDLIRADPTLGTRLVAGRPDLAAEAVYAVEHEMALTLEDVMRRRLHLCYELRDGGLHVARRVAELIGATNVLRWDPHEIDEQVDAYRAVVRRTRPPGGDPDLTPERYGDPYHGRH